MFYAAGADGRLVQMVLHSLCTVFLGSHLYYNILKTPSELLTEKYAAFCSLSKISLPATI